MDSVQRELVSALLQHVFSLGLLSRDTYGRAEDLVRGHGAPRRSEGLPEEGAEHECAQGPQ